MKKKETKIANNRISSSLCACAWLLRCTTCTEHFPNPYILYIFDLKCCLVSGESFKAHRLVLAACSTHFSKIFSTSPLNGQLIVILDGTRAQDLQILLQFMYRGVAFLPSDRIESVLRTGEVLQVNFAIFRRKIREKDFLLYVYLR